MKDFDTEEMRRIVTAPGNPPPPESVYVPKLSEEDEERLRKIREQEEADEPVRKITLRERKPITEGPRPDVFFYLVDAGVDGVMTVKTSAPVKVPLGMSNFTIRFRFKDSPALCGGVPYTVKLFENGLTRISQQFIVERDTPVVWLNTVVARPGAKWANLQIKIMSGDLIVAESVRVMVGRQR